MLEEQGSCTSERRLCPSHPTPEKKNGIRVHAMKCSQTHRARPSQNDVYLS